MDKGSRIISDRVAFLSTESNFPLGKDLLKVGCRNIIYRELFCRVTPSIFRLGNFSILPTNSLIKLLTLTEIVAEKAEI